MSWTSNWRIPRVRFIASRAIAKTSGRTSSRADWMRSFSRLAAGLRQLAAALEVRVVALVLGRLVGLRDLADLLADLGEPLADLVVGERGDLGLELVGLVDDGLETSELAVSSSRRIGRRTSWPAEV